ncbi:MAG TPA: dihydrofolate reductase family protein [Pseudonocardiaceae bacterium]|nr:dihydrofolate reductase family protein [Pseudonocardiaceae bacterium]
MGRIIVTNNVSLDGVMQAPARPNEDTRGGFTRGGWANAYQDDVLAAEMAGGMSRSGALLLGRRTYEDFHQVWPNRRDNPFTEILDNTQKYVVATTLAEPLPWQNSTLIADDVIATLAKLKDQLTGDLAILGSGALIRSLLPHGLIDEFVLITVPLLLGTGQRLFPTDGDPVRLELVRSVPTTKGALVTYYRPA